MKKIYLILAIVFLGLQFSVMAQDDGGVSIGKGDVDADPSAILELVSSNKGILIPRLSTTERDAISAPASGLLVYDTSLSNFYYWNGTSWNPVAGVTFSSGATFPATAREGDLFFNTTDALLYISVASNWETVGSHKQILQLTDATLKLLEEGATEGSEVDLSVLYQDLSLDGTNLSISDGSSIDLSSITVKVASDIAVTPGGDLTSTTVQAALEELQTEIANSGNGDMSQSTYDTNGNGTVDNAETAATVNGKTVGTSVPSGAVFTDNQQLSISGTTITLSNGGQITLPGAVTGGDMLQSTYDANTDGVVDNAATVNSLTVQTAVPAGAVFTDDQTAAEVALSATYAKPATATAIAASDDLETAIGKLDRKVEDAVSGSGDMAKTTYDTDDNGVVDVAATVSDNAITSAKIATGAVGNTDLDKANIPLSGFGNATADVAVGNGTTNYKITNVLDPTNNQDVATKKYVDDNIASAGGGDMLKSVYDNTTNGLTDGVIDRAEKVSDGAITPTSLALASGNTTGDGYMLTYDNATASFKWMPASSGSMTNPMTAAADIVYSADASGTPTRLAIGTNNQVLTVAAGVPAWRDAGGGDMLASVYDNATNGTTTGVVDRAETVVDNAITSAKILDGTIATADLGDASVTSAKIVDGTVAAADLAADAVTSAKIADAAVVPANLALASGNTATDGYVLSYDNATSSFKWKAASAGDMLKSAYDDATVGTHNGTAVDFAEYAYDLMDNTVTTSKILDGEVATADMADGAITSAKILDGTIAATDIATGAITTAKILDGTIATGDLADDAVTSAKILDGTIVAGNIAAGTITTTQISDGTIATIDIANSAITSAKIADGTIAAADIAQMGATDGQILKWSTANSTWEPADASTGSGTLTNVSVTTANGISGTVDNTNAAVPAISLDLGAITPTSVAINATDAAAHTSAALDITSTSQGILIPRMTQTQRDAITTPAEGLMIYQTDATAGFYYYDGSAWAAVAGAGGASGDLSVVDAGDANYTATATDDIITFSPTVERTLTFPTNPPIGKRFVVVNLGLQNVIFNPPPQTTGVQAIYGTMAGELVYVGNGNWVMSSGG